jgi:hypothetical protein
MGQLTLVAHGKRDAEWSELAGPFETFGDAADWCVEPPEAMTFEGAVTVEERRVGAFYVLAQDAPAVAA